MATLYYEIFFAISMLLTLAYAVLWHKHFSIYITLMFIFIPLTNLGYVLMSLSTSLESAQTGLKITYIGGCYMVLFIMLSIFNLCKIKMPKWVSLLLLSISTFVFCMVLTIGQGELFYKSAAFIQLDGSGYIIDKEYGFGHTVFIAVIFAYFSISVLAILYAYFVKTEVSSRILFRMFLPEIVCMLCYFVGRLITDAIELMSMAYVFAQIMFLIIIRRVCLYDITDTGIDSLVSTGDTGFISFDFDCDYLGSNETANAIFPELKSLTVDERITSKKLNDLFLPWIETFKKDENEDKHYFKKNDKTYLVDINYLYNGTAKKGYQLFITDDTANQNYISLLDNYNKDLENQVEAKTADIVAMHDRLIVSMATMVESRDNSTGGHIKRTSEVVRLLMDEVMKDNTLGLTDSFVKNIIKAAPMHDLGKIAVDDAILRKPGRFEPEEFEKMKAHAAEGARIVHEILKGTDDQEFHIIAENVAHYHHERWDGSGYPEGLKGDDIPIEARIMAIADVYDALVSKRVYKDAMSFEKADSIILEGMGKHFDKSLEKYYVAARPAMELYYSQSA
ncbi:MAG: HD domain-containing protein [Lachnospiraceae bacterium]|nr:HD domain-containing protein [Lachnospiraceae bacterium]